MDLLQNIRRLKQAKAQLIQQGNSKLSLPISSKEMSTQIALPNLLNSRQNNHKQKKDKQHDNQTTQKNINAEQIKSEIKKEQNENQDIKVEKQQNLIDQKEEKNAKSVRQDTVNLNQKGVFSFDRAQHNTRQKKQQEGGIFRGLKFGFPIYNVQLKKQRCQVIKRTIQNNEGEVYLKDDLEEFQQCYQGQPGEYQQQQSFTIDFMLVDPKIPRETIEPLIPKTINYLGIVDFNYVFNCINKRKIVDYRQYLVPQKSNQLEMYMKVKEAQTRQELENSHRHRWTNKYTLGIQPIQFVPANQTSKPIQNTNDKSGTNAHSTGQNDQNTSKQIPKPLPNSQPKSFNKFIYQSFQKLSELFEKSDRGRSFAYSRIATVLKTVKIQITCEEDADKLQGMRFIGPKTIQKIKQFIRKGSIQKLTVMEGKQENLVCQKLQKVWGIGKVRAEELYSRGIKSVEELRQAVQKGEIALTKNQNTGLKYYQDLNQRIPREKVTRMFQYIKKTLFKIVGNEVDHKIQTCGSYRRGKQTCGDIDVIITRKDGTFQARLINNLVEELTAEGFLTDHLAMPRHADPKSCISYMGICKFENEIHHRVDLKYYPVDQYAYAILYFTGSDMFNRNMRLYAMKNGFCLSDHGMCKAEKIAGNIVTDGPNIPCYSEEEIFEKLGIKYKAPSERSL